MSRKRPGQGKGPIGFFGPTFCICDILVTGSRIVVRDTLDIKEGSLSELKLIRSLYEALDLNCLCVSFF